MTTIFRHRRSNIGSKTPTAGNLQTGELAINLASSKIHTTRTLNSGTFVGTVSSIIDSDVTTLIFTGNINVRAGTTIAARTTASGDNAFAPNINTAIVNQNSTTDRFNIRRGTLDGRQFAIDDHIWLVGTDESEQVLEISGHSSASTNEPLNPNNGDIWVDISGTSPQLMIYNGNTFERFVSGGGGGSGGDFSEADLEDSDTQDIDFGLVLTLGTVNEPRNTALATTYSAVEYDFGGVRSPRPGPDFGGIE